MRALVEPRGFRLRAVRALVCGGAVWLALPTPAHAYRPFLGTDTRVTPPRAIETELGPLGYRRTADERAVVLPELVLNYGLGAGYEVSLGARRVMASSADPAARPRIEDSEFSVKKLLRTGAVDDQSHGPSVAAEETVLLPTTDERGAGVEGALIVAEKWQHVTGHVNVSVSDTRAHTFGRFASVIVEGPAWQGVRPVTELAVERDGDEPVSRSLLLGLLWETRDGITMDFAFRTTRADVHTIEVLTGVTFKHHVPAGPKLGGSGHGH